MRALLVPVGSDLFAVPTSWVREVVASPHPTPLPTAPAMLLGVFNLRGEIVPLFDTAALLDIGRVPTLDYAAVLNTSHGAAGLVATAIPEVVILDELVGPSDLAATDGSYALGNRVAVLLDVEALLNPVRFAGPGGSAMAVVR